MKNLFKTVGSSMLGERKSLRNDKTQSKKFAHKKRAFTLVEILIVVAVIGILFVTLVPRIDFAGDKARETGVKTEFRSFELAAEQLIRENAGLGDFDDIADLAGANGINLYLDKAIQFEDDGECLKKDEWNQPYTIQIVKDATDDNPNNGAIIFLSNGKDSSLSETSDNYALAVAYVDGQIEATTTGFSTNIESGLVEKITPVGDAPTMDISGKEVEYKKN